MFCLIVSPSSTATARSMQLALLYLQRRLPRRPCVRVVDQNVIAVTAPEELSLSRDERGESLLMHGPYRMRSCARTEICPSAAFIDRIAHANPNHHIVWSSVKRRTVFVRCARVGFRPLYYHRTADGITLISSHLIFQRILAGPLSPDPVGMMQQLGASACTGTRTLLERVSRIPAETVLQMTGADYSEHCFSAPDRDYDVRISEANEERLLGIAQKVVCDTVPEQHLCVALSGGLDSRFLLFASLLARKQACAITLGHPGWLDVDLARALTSALRIPHVITRPKPSSTVAQLRYILDEVEHLSDYLSPIWLNEFRTALIQTSSPVLNGFFGGPLTGGLSSPSCDPSTTSPSAVSRWLREVNKCSIRWSLLRRVCRVPVTPIRRMVQKYASGLMHLTAGSIRALEFNYRQRGFVYLNTGNLYSLYCNVRTPFADLRLREFFEGLTSQDLRQQALYRRVLKMLDTTGVPVASTTSRMYRPETFTSGPREFLFQSYRTLRPAIRDMIASTREQLDAFFDVDQLLKIINAARRDPSRGVPAFTEALLLVNAALWWLYARERP